MFICNSRELKLILKEKEISNSKDIRVQAGEKQEQDVAFYLRRAFKDREDICVFNDIRIEHNDEVAQIDHLVLYVYGFILIESKSITGEVRVNENEEWSRSYHGKWSGIKSPIKQVELQQRLLRELLFERRHEILPKKLLGKLQQSFGGRCWDNICAVSSNAILDRNNMPKSVSSQLVKSEFLIDKINEVMNLPSNKITDFLSINTRPDFKAKDMEKISQFLIDNHKSTLKQLSILSKQPEIPSNTNIPSYSPNKTQVMDASNQDIIEETLNESAYQHNPVQKCNLNASSTQSVQSVENVAAVILESSTLLACKECHSNNALIASPGRYGYYVKCSHCQANTAMKKQCPSCSSTKTKVSKKKNAYYLLCTECNAKDLIFTQEDTI